LPQLETFKINDVRSALDSRAGKDSGKLKCGAARVKCKTYSMGKAARDYVALYEDLLAERVH
jgi:hypothetical protein